MSEIHQIYLSCSFYIFKKIQTLIYFLKVFLLSFFCFVCIQICASMAWGVLLISAVKTQSHVIRLIQPWTKYMELFPQTGLVHILSTSPVLLCGCFVQVLS